MSCACRFHVPFTDWLLQYWRVKKHWNGPPHFLEHDNQVVFSVTAVHAMNGTTSIKGCKISTQCQSVWNICSV